MNNSKCNKILHLEVQINFQTFKRIWIFNILFTRNDSLFYKTFILLISSILKILFSKLHVSLKFPRIIFDGVIIKYLKLIKERCNVDTHILSRQAAAQPWGGPRSANTWTCLDLLGWPFTLKHTKRRRLLVKLSTVYAVNISRFQNGNVSSTRIDTTLPQLDTFNLVLPWDAILPFLRSAFVFTTELTPSEFTVCRILLLTVTLYSLA